MSDNPKDYASSFLRRSTHTVYVGRIPIGSGFPVRIQSMTNTLTGDVNATVEQCIRIIDAGADFVRITVPSLAEADSFGKIKEKLRSRGYQTPLIADVHFNTAIAMKAAAVADKVRINPGNFGISGKFRKSRYTSEEYSAEWEKQRKVFVDFLALCREHQTAVRIGVNHGSLSDRIMNRFGDTPEGMVESALEFLRICRDENFHAVVVSLKASNTLVMVYATRLLVARMEKEGMQYPLHLGVTEAGEGEDGRIKSAIGIGTLLADGIGDTIRISLTEAPEAEIPVAKKLVEICAAADMDGVCRNAVSPVVYARRMSHTVGTIGGGKVPVVLVSANNDPFDKYGHPAKEDAGQELLDEVKPDYLVISDPDDDSGLPYATGMIVPAKNWLRHKDNKNLFPLFSGKEILDASILSADMNFLRLDATDVPEEIRDFIKGKKNIVIIADMGSRPVFSTCRHFFEVLARESITAPVILKGIFNESEKENYQLTASVQLGSLLVDGLGDGIWLEGLHGNNAALSCSTAFAILQATRTRVSKTEYIACPSCGRTHFNLMETLAAIKSRTSHLKGLKIGVMGCIVNGPGEMADADYGYVGSGKGMVTLYKAKEVIKRNIPEASALDELIRIIKESGDWWE
jgi:(E)-4-hydroxy-3-methylbut-2-enyl-diphosphate synthase